MFLKTNADLAAFFTAVHRCSGDVIFVSTENDTLNLKSELTKFIFIAAYVQKDYTLNGSIICRNPQDMKILTPFLEETYN